MHHAAYQELAIGVECITKVGLGGPRADLATKTRVVEAAMRWLCRDRNIHNTSAGQRHLSYANVFAPRVTSCCRSSCGIPLRGVTRRPLWGNTIDKFIAQQLQNAREAAICTHRDDLPRIFGVGFRLAHFPDDSGAPQWSTNNPALLQIRDQLQAAAAAIGGAKKPKPKCFFGCPNKCVRRQDLVPFWRKVPHGEPLCSACRDIMERELNQPNIDIVALAEAPPPHKRKRRQGPCFFRCATSSSSGHRGVEAWHGLPADAQWNGAPGGSTLCGSCFSRYKAQQRRKPKRSQATRSGTPTPRGIPVSNEGHIVIPRDLDSEGTGIFESPPPPRGRTNSGVTTRAVSGLSIVAAFRLVAMAQSTKSCTSKAKKLSKFLIRSFRQAPLSNLWGLRFPRTSMVSKLSAA